MLYVGTYDFKCFVLVKLPTHEPTHSLADKYVFLFVFSLRLVVNLLYVV